MAKHLEFATEMLRADAGFHTDQARRQVASRISTWPRDPLLPQHDGTAVIMTYDVLLADIDADHSDRCVTGTAGPFY